MEPQLQQVGIRPDPLTERLMRWWYAVSAEQEHWQDTAVAAARGAAAADGAVLRSEVPVYGWVSAQHSRDGLAYPCKDSTAGAVRAWIWYGDTR
jgi:hypothetical protein